MIIIRHDPETGLLIPAVLYQGVQYRKIFLRMKPNGERKDILELPFPVPHYEYIEITQDTDPNGFYNFTFGLQYNPKTGAEKHPIGSFGIAKRDIEELELGERLG